MKGLPAKVTMVYISVIWWDGGVGVGDGGEDNTSGGGDDDDD